MSIEVKKILVPVDFSSSAINALKVSVQLAKKLTANLEIMHVYYILASGGDTALFVDDVMIENGRKLAKDKLKRLTDEIPELTSIPWTISIEYGQPSAAILKRLMKGDVDLVTVGAKGEGGIIDKLIGSTTYDIMNSASIPVISIPEFTSNINWINMVLAFDKAGIEANYFEDWIKYLHQKFEANFQVVHVETSVNQHETRRENIDYQQFFGEIPFKHFEITGSSVDKRMVQFTKDINADMLIIFPRKDHLFTHLFSKSLTKSLSNKLHIPILALHFPGNM